MILRVVLFLIYVGLNFLQEKIVIMYVLLFKCTLYYFLLQYLKGYSLLAIFLAIYFWNSDIYLLNFGVAMLQYEVYSKLMNRVYLLEYGVFIRQISPRHCGYTGIAEGIHVISWLRILRRLVGLQNKGTIHKKCYFGRGR